MTPLEYIHHHRAKLAQKIIRHTRIRKYKVAYVVGFTNQNLLYRAYGKYIGCRPKDEAAADAKETRAILEKFLTESDDPRISTNTAEVPVASKKDNLAEFWDVVRDLDQAAIKSHLWNSGSDITIGHFYLLIEKSRYEGRRDPARAEELAHDALDSLRLVGFTLGKSLLGEMAFGYAVLSNACRLQLKFEEAVFYLREADEHLPKDRSKKPRLFAEVNLFRVALFWWRKDSDRALSLLNDILPDIRLHGSGEFLARALQLGAEINDCTGHPGRAVEFFSEAASLADSIDDRYVVFSAHYNLTFLYTRLSKRQESLSQIAKVRECCSGIGILSFHMSFLEGCVSRLDGKLRKAELLLLEARDGYIGQDMNVHGALAFLELALVYLDLEDSEKALLSAINAIPLLSHFSSNRNVVAALAALQEAADRQRIDSSTVRAALSQIDYLRKDPVAIREAQSTLSRG